MNFYFFIAPTALYSLLPFLMMIIVGTGSLYCSVYNGNNFVVMSNIDNSIFKNILYEYDSRRKSQGLYTASRNKRR